ncbi:helix-turn-helix transcriptional regulator [Ligilactobacillus animalis]|uniref:helix-turn-helix transcriptional regulator n=1 Tax=Ligilactobacillus animalis TaxID=1605 RepID=UPI00384D704F
MSTLKGLRANKNLSQSELGELLGVSQTTVTAWETGKTVPNSKNVFELAKLYSVEPTVIFNAIFKQKS